MPDGGKQHERDKARGQKTKGEEHDQFDHASLTHTLGNTIALNRPLRNRARIVANNYG